MKEADKEFRRKLDSAREWNPPPKSDLDPVYLNKIGACSEALLEVFSLLHNLCAPFVARDNLEDGTEHPDNRTPDEDALSDIEMEFQVLRADCSRLENVLSEHPRLYRLLKHVNDRPVFAFRYPSSSFVLGLMEFCNSIIYDSEFLGVDYALNETVKAYGPCTWYEGKLLRLEIEKEIWRGHKVINEMNRVPKLDTRSEGTELPARVVLNGRITREANLARNEICYKLRNEKSTWPEVLDYVNLNAAKLGWDTLTTERGAANAAKAHEKRLKDGGDMNGNGTAH